MQHPSLVMGGLVAVILTGCVGNDDGHPAFADDGIYLNNRKDVVMLVDSTRHSTPIVIEDFGNNEVYLTNHVTTTRQHQMKTSGLAHFITGRFNIDPNHYMNATFDKGVSMLETLVEGRTQLYTLTKAADSLPLSKIAGRHRDTNGSELTIHEDGSFTDKESNGCLIKGNLTRHRFYFNITAQVSRCANKRLIGNDYEGILVTAKLEGQEQIASIIANDDDIMWGITPNS